MSAPTGDEVFSEAWVRVNIRHRLHPVVIVRLILPWEVSVKRLAQDDPDSKGPVGKPLRLLGALLLGAKWDGLSDRGVVAHVTDNRSMQYFCNVPEKGGRPFCIPPAWWSFGSG